MPAHHPKFDVPTPAVALCSEAFYLGALGSRKTLAGCRDRPRQLLFAQADLDRIHGPIGLPIGRTSPGEVAASIHTEIVLVLRADRSGHRTGRG